MASKPETRFITSVERFFELKTVPYRMKNNNEFIGGVADKWYSGAAGDLWVEYKFLPTMPQRGVMGPDRYALSGLQRDWLKGRYEEGRTVAVIIGCPTGGVILLDLEWDSEITVQSFRERVISREGIANWIKHITIG